MARLTFRYSTMNAGKSIEVLKIAHNYEEQGKTALLFTPKIDNRYGVGKITSRIGISKEAIIVKEDTDIFYEVSIRRLVLKKISCVLIDEAQFLSEEHVYQLTKVVDDFEIPVIAYGLKNTFNNELFVGTKALLIYADRIEEVKTVCWYCDRKATMNMRIDKKGNAITKGETIKIGGNESYLPVCRKCYKEKTSISRDEEAERNVRRKRLNNHITSNS